jgi:hypothetical protein
MCRTAALQSTVVYIKKRGFGTTETYQQPAAFHSTLYLQPRERFCRAGKERLENSVTDTEKKKENGNNNNQQQNTV